MSSRSSSSAALAIPKPPSSGTRRRRQALQHDAPLPAVDDRLVKPETRAEIIDGKVYFVAPAGEPHATSHLDLGAVLRAHLARGYSGAIDMLTRTSTDDDFAPDGSVFPTERDPVTGGRKLEEIAFEIASKQSLTVPTRKARKLVKRGVRRVFCIVLKKRRVLEWSRETDAFQPLANDYRIDDRCFVCALPVRALLDGAQSDRAIMEALRAREDATLMTMLDEAHDAGFDKGLNAGFDKGLNAGFDKGHDAGFEKGRLVERRQTLYLVLREKRHIVDDATRQEIDQCTDLATLERWLMTAIRSAPRESTTGDCP